MYFFYYYYQYCCDNKKNKILRTIKDICSSPVTCSPVTSISNQVMNDQGWLDSHQIAGSPLNTIKFDTHGRFLRAGILRCLHDGRNIVCTRQVSQDFWWIRHAIIFVKTTWLSQKGFIQVLYSWLPLPSTDNNTTTTLDPGRTMECNQSAA